jgi:PAS domain-containing protein
LIWGETMTTEDIDYQRVFRTQPSAMALLTPSFVILDVNEKFLETMARRPRAELIGRNIFDVFPAMPREPGTDPRPALTSLSAVLSSGMQDVMELTRYDLPDSRNPAVFEEHYWSAINSPVMRDDGSIGMLECRVEDVTHIVIRSRSLQAQLG